MIEENVVEVMAPAVEVEVEMAPAVEVEVEMAPEVAE